jgi:hypothetical protein
VAASGTAGVRLGSTVTLIVATLVLGFALGRWTAPDPDTGARRALEEHGGADRVGRGRGLDLVVGRRVPVSEALVALQRRGPAAWSSASADAWLAAYDEVLDRLVASSSPTRPVRSSASSSGRSRSHATPSRCSAAQADGLPSGCPPSGAAARRGGRLTHPRHRSADPDRDARPPRTFPDTDGAEER